MAVQRNNVLMQGTSGSFNRQITFRQYGGKTVISRYPDMSRVIFTKAQLAERIRFKLAVAYARAVIADPVKKKAYSGKKHFSAYHAAIADYIRTSKTEENKQAEPLPAQPDTARTLQLSSSATSAQLIPDISYPETAGPPPL